MSSDRMSVSTDDRIRNGTRWSRIKSTTGLGLLSVAVVGVITAIAAESPDDLKLPASFRHWYHVNTMVIDKGSPLFEAMGGMHNVYINSTGETALKKGEPYPNKTVLLVDLHEFTISDGSHVEGPRKATAIMLNDKKKYAATGGWGFQAWAGGDPTKPLVTDPAKQCFECHQLKKNQEYVYSTYIP
jgi:Cytochrome P460